MGHFDKYGLEKTRRPSEYLTMEYKCKTTDGATLIAAERKRQIEQEGWTAEHDEQNDHCELAIAASCYALPFDKRNPYNGILPNNWPWREEWWKPTPGNRIRELVKAGALIAAEIDRLRAGNPNA